MSKFENKLREYMGESSLNRIRSATQSHDYGAITAFRYARDCGTGERYVRRENLQRNKSLFNKLKSLGYGITAVKGAYIENYGTADAREVGESSYFVVDLQDKGSLKKDLMKLGEEFEQDSILFGSAGSEPMLIGTSDCENAYPGMGKVVKLSGGLFGKSGEFMTRVKGRPFIFTEDVGELECHKYPTELRGAAKIARQEWHELEA
jgi:hypothetical protein